MSAEARLGEVWLVDFGVAARVRPVVLLSVPLPTDARSLVVVAPLTSQLRGLRGEVDIGKPRSLPKHPAVKVQGLASVDHNALGKKLGKLSYGQFGEVESSFRELLEL